MNIQQLLDDPATYTQLLHYAEQHSTVVRRGFDPGDVLEYSIKILYKLMNQEERDIKKTPGFLQMIVGMAMKDVKRDFVRDKYNESSRWDTLHPAAWSTEDIPVQDEVKAAGVNQALDTLPDRQRQALILRFVDGWEVKEIGQELGISHQRVTQMLRQAKRNMKKSLETTLPAYGKRSIEIPLSA